MRKVLIVVLSNKFMDSDHYKKNCIVNKDLEEVFEKAKKIKPKINLNAEKMDKLIEDGIFR